MKQYQATSLVMIAALASAAFGLLREVIVAHQFGTGAETDAYFFTYELMVGLPDFLLAAITAGLIPIFIRCKKEGQETGFTSTVINVYFLFLLALSGLMVFVAPFISATLTAGFDEANRRLVTNFLWILSPTIVLTGMWGVLKTLLDAERRFLAANISRVFLSLGVIGGVVFGASRLGAYSLPVGIAVAILCQVLWVAYWLRRAGFGYRLRIDVGNDHFRQFLTLLAPGIVGAMLLAIIPLMDKSIASHLEPGTLAALSFAGRPMSVLQRIGVHSFTVVLLPTLALKALESNRTLFTADVSRTLNVVMFATVPMGVLLAVLRVPIIQLLYERGKFDTAATANTANIFAALVIGVTPLAISVTLSTAFKSMEDARTPAIFGAGGALVSKAVFNALLVVPLGAMGIALATSLRYVTTSLLLLFVLRSRLGSIGGRQLLGSLLQHTTATLLAVAPVYGLVTYGGLPPAVMLAVGLFVGTLLYLVISALLGSPEPQLIWAALVRFRRNRGNERVPTN